MISKDRRCRAIIAATTITTILSRFMMILFIILSLVIHNGQCRLQNPYCHLTGGQVLKATFNKSSGELLVVNRDEGNGWRDRSLLSSISSSKKLLRQSQHNNYVHNDPRRSAARALSATRLLVEEQMNSSNASPTNSNNNGTDNETMVVQVRECFCSSQPSEMTIYCPVEFDICDIRNELKGETTCYTPQRSEIVTNAFPFIVLSYIFLAAMLVLTLKGKQIRTYLYRLCCMSKEHRDQAVRDQVDYIVVQQPAVSSSIMRRYRRRQQDEQFRALRRLHLLESAPPIVRRIMTTIRRNSSSNDEDQQQPGTSGTLPPTAGVGLDHDIHESAAVATAASQGRPIELALKTKRYKSTISNNSTQNDEKQPQQAGDDASCINDCDQCSICLGQFVDGERIGALSCQHEFHVDCLKSWLKRKNACPLCQKPNVATIRVASSSSDS